VEATDEIGAFHITLGTCVGALPIGLTRKARVAIVGVESVQRIQAVGNL
jgi:hypothetical protein